MSHFLFCSRITQSFLFHLFLKILVSTNCTDFSLRYGVPCSLNSTGFESMFKHILLQRKIVPNVWEADVAVRAGQILGLVWGGDSAGQQWTVWSGTLAYSDQHVEILGSQAAVWGMRGRRKREGLEGWVAANARRGKRAVEARQRQTRWNSWTLKHHSDPSAKLLGTFLSGQCPPGCIQAFPYSGSFLSPCVEHSL